MQFHYHALNSCRPTASSSTLFNAHCVLADRVERGSWIIIMWAAEVTKCKGRRASFAQSDRPLLLVLQILNY